jgi:DNA-binding XRE family transcriptional regulator
MVTFCYNKVNGFQKNLGDFCQMNERNGLIGLKIIRKQKKYSQLKIAMDLSISREALSYYENGKRNPDLQMLRLLSEYFNVSIDFLINGKEFEPK